MTRHDEQPYGDQYNAGPEILTQDNPLTSPSKNSKGGGYDDSVVAHPAVAAVMPGTVLSPAARRKAASNFLSQATGVFVPFASDQDFRGALKDGVLLCKVAVAVWGDEQCQWLDAADVEAGPHGLWQQRNHNVTAFLTAVEKWLPALPADGRFSIADLEADGTDDRPQVAKCLLYIQAACQQQVPQLPPMLQQFAAQPTVVPHSSSATGSRQQYADTPMSQVQMRQPQSPYTPHAALPAPQQHLFLGSPGGCNGSPGMLQLQHRSLPGHQSPIAALHSPLMNGQSNLSHGSQLTQFVQHHSHPGNPLSPTSHTVAGVMRSSHYGSSISAATTKSVQAAAGVTRLMQHCTTMLKERMGLPMDPGSAGGRYSGSPGGPDSAMKALGPVLEQVLSHLTEEYEKRLLAKDHDLSRMNEANKRLEKELARVQAELDQLKQEAAIAGAAVAREAAAASAAEVEVLQQELAEARSAVADKEQELEAVQGMLSSADKTRADEAMRAQMECHRLREELDGLQDLHERYKRAIEENRNLYNTVQDLRGNIRVFCRIRPPGATGDLSPCCVDIGLEGDLAVYDQHTGNKRVFKVDRVFDQNCDQAVVYEDTQPLIRSVLDGYNVCIFAYGQTGSGKTHTMSGTHTMHEEGRGINYRALNDLFAIRDARAHEVTYEFRVQMLEIYNENLRDLLVDGRSNIPNKLEILATQSSGCNVPGATQIAVSGATDVANLMAKGASQRATSETKMNDRSSRSHQILTVIVDGIHHVTGARSHGCLHLIDLAGSERVSKSEASGDRLIEAQHINKSLSALGDVMAALASKDRHIPYRNSKLTQLLQDSLQGQAKVMMFMHISPEANMFGESLSTLKFASRVSEITLGQAKKNVVSGKVFEAHEEMLKQQRFMESREQQVQQLQAALAQERQLNEKLQQQLLERGDVPAQAAVTKQRSQVLQLPIQQMLAAQAAEAQAIAPAAAAALPSSGSRSRLITGGTEDGGYGGSPASVSRAAGRPRVDMTPSRDQDDSLMSARSNSLVEHLDFSSVEATPRPTPRRASINNSGLPLPPREHSSAQKHLDRLQSARQFGTYRSSSANTALHTTGSMTHRQPGGSPGVSNLKAEASKLTGHMTARGAHTAVTTSTRSSGRTDQVAPLTSRISGVIKSRVSELPPSGTMSMRQSSVYRPSSTAAAWAPAPTQRTTSAATSRSGSRWK